MKRVLLIVSLLVTIFLAGCAKESLYVTSDKLLEVLKTNKYEITDSSSNVGYADSAYMGKKGNIELTYVKGKKRYDIEGIFLDECKNIYNIVGEDYEEKVINGKESAGLEITGKEKYFYIFWSDDMYIEITGRVKDKKEILKLLDELK